MSFAPVLYGCYCRPSAVRNACRDDTDFVLQLVEFTPSTLKLAQSVFRRRQSLLITREKGAFGFVSKIPLIVLPAVLAILLAVSSQVSTLDEIRASGIWNGLQLEGPLGHIGLTFIAFAFLVAASVFLVLQPGRVQALEDAQAYPTLLQLAIDHQAVLAQEAAPIPQQRLAAVLPVPGTNDSSCQQTETDLILARR
jgi:hypothetical protein